MKFQFSTAETERRREKVDKEILETLKTIAQTLRAPPLPKIVKPELAPAVRVITTLTEPIKSELSRPH